MTFEPEHIHEDKPARRVTRRNRSDSAQPTRARRVMVEDEPVAGADTVEALDRDLASNVKMTRERRKLLSRRRRALLMSQDNPFINERPSVLPLLPFTEDPDHAYLWTRFALHGERDGDRSNLAAKTTGHLQYELVRMDMIPEHWQARASPYATADGRIVYRDVELRRAPQRIRDMKLAAQEHEADVAADQLNGQLRAQIGQRGNTRAAIEEDMEDAE